MFLALVSLLQDEEVLEMVEKMMEAMDHGLLMDTPFLRRIRAEGREEAMRQSILDVIAARLAPPVTRYHQLEARLMHIVDSARLRELLQDALRAEDIDSFEMAIARRLQS
jgi:hypothetical protein